MAKFSVTISKEEVEQAIVDYIKDRIDAGYQYKAEATAFTYNGEYKDHMYVDVAFELSRREDK